MAHKRIYFSVRDVIDHPPFAGAKGDAYFHVTYLDAVTTLEAVSTEPELVFRFDPATDKQDRANDVNEPRSTFTTPNGAVAGMSGKGGKTGTKRVRVYVFVYDDLAPFWTSWLDALFSPVNTDIDSTFEQPLIAAVFP
jgi:hypothetical protein